jgi:hypothetical protein
MYTPFDFFSLIFNNPEDKTLLWESGVKTLWDFRHNESKAK